MLKLQFFEDIDTETCSALKCLTRLRCLELHGTHNGNNIANIQLQLPQLKWFTLHEFWEATILLDCPQLKGLMLLKLKQLQEISGLPDSTERLQLEDLGAGSVPLEQILQEQGLKHLSRLDLQNCPGMLRWQDLPLSLEHLALWLPLDKGIHPALEQLTRLTNLMLGHVGEGLMHLTRPLEPFLDMASLVILNLQTPLLGRGNSDWWTPAALGLLGLADRHVLRMQSVPGGKKFRLTY